MGQRGFAGAGGAQESDRLAGLDRKAHVTQDIFLAVAVVAEGDVVEDDAALGRMRG